MSAIPDRIDLMPETEARIAPKRAIAVALNSVPYEWWPGKRNKSSHAFFSEDSAPVRAVLQAIEKAGYRIVER